MNTPSQKKGAVLIMALIITSGILVLGSELVLFVLHSLQYGRSVDYSTIAQYASESGVENTLWQIRKEERDTLDISRAKVSLDTQELGYEWNFLDSTNNAIDPTKFSSSVDRIEKMFLSENESVQVNLYTYQSGGIAHVADIYKMKVSWESSACAPADQKPWIETSIVQWDEGNSINWNSAQVKKDFQQPLSADTFIFVNFSAYSMNGKPMIVRVKTLFCDLSRFTLTIHKDDDTVLNIPNYIIANPTGSYRRFQQTSRVVFPQKSALSNMFDFVLFSEDQLQK
jgi:hypothetical protein